MVPSNERLGWDSFFADAARQLLDDRSLNLPDDLTFARIVEEQRGAYRVDGECVGWVEVSGRFRHTAALPAEFPAVGDWVAMRHKIIHARLERRSTMSRTAPSGDEQVMAANVDTIFVVASLTHERNARRAERYVTMAWDAGAVPVVVLNKADLVQDPGAEAEEMRRRLAFVDVHAISALAGDASGLNVLDAYLVPAKTIALVGPSGVGKSTIVNQLLGREAQKTGDVRAHDSKGRHTTTARQLVELPSGALLIDTPGLRELQPGADGEAVDAAFDDVTALAAECRFADCAHVSEPDCAVLAAVARGELDADRLESYRRLLREAAFENRKHDKAAAAEQKRRWRQLHQAQKALYRDRGRS